jgi:hypothetical protein
MKKLFLAVLCAGLFFACGNKKQAEPEALMDTVPAQQEEVVQQEPEEVAEPVADEPVAQAAPAKKPAATPKKNNNNTGMTAGKTNEAPTVKEHAESSANRIANKAIDKAEQETTNAIVNSGKKKR